MLSIISFGFLHADDGWIIKDKTLIILRDGYGGNIWTVRDYVNRVIISDGVTSIKANTFNSWQNLTSISIPNSVKKIEYGAFWGCAKLTSISIPNSVTSIEHDAFRECKLTSINIPNSVTTIGERAFMDSKDLASVSVSAKTIGFEAFYRCKSLTSVNIGNSVTSIGELAFAECTSLTSINIPNSVTTIGKNAFSMCSSLTSINIPNSVTTIGESAFWGCSDLTSITIPNSVTSIGNGAFSGCSGLTSITIPNSVTRIEDSTFAGCSSLKSISIGNAVTYIGEHALFDCESLLNFTCNTLVPPSWAEYNSVQLPPYKQVTLYVPASAVSTYKANADWIWDWWKIIKAIPQTDKPTGISFANASESILLGKTKTLKATITPENAVKTITWASSNTAVATVSTKGIVTAKSIGSAVITAKTSNGLTAKCKVTVKKPVTSITLNNATVSIWTGKTKTLTATIAPTDASNKNVTWTSSNTNVTTVSSSGVVTAKAKGTATINCKAADGSGVKATCTVTVKQPVTAIELSATTATLWVGKTKTLTATATPTTASNTAVKWTSSNTSVATVSSKGVVSAKGKGTCTITCTAADGYGTKATCKVTVKQQVTSIDMGIETLTIACGTTKTITPIVNPSNANVRTLTWKSKNTKVATVTSAGVVKAIAVGTTQITCTATDDFKKSATITVNVVPVSITDSKPTIAEGTYGAGCISYTRTLTAGKYAAFCLPYSVNLNDYTDEFSKVFVPMGMTFLKTNGTLVVTFEKVSFTETIPAGQPFVALAAKSGSVAIVNDVKEIFTSITEPEPTSLKVYNWNGSNGFFEFNPDVTTKIGGTYSKLTGLDSEKYYTVSTSGTMSKATTVSPYRIYVYKDDNNSNAKITDIIFSFDENEMATGVEKLRITNDESPVYYNMSGQRINKAHAQKGIYINKGRKYVK